MGVGWSACRGMPPMVDGEAGGTAIRSGGLWGNAFAEVMSAGADGIDGGVAMPATAKCPPMYIHVFT